MSSAPRIQTMLRGQDVHRVCARKEPGVGLLAYDDFADLNHRRQIRVVGNVSHDLLGMRPKAVLEGLDGVAVDVTHSDKGRGSAGRSTRDSIPMRRHAPASPRTVVQLRHGWLR